MNQLTRAISRRTAALAAATLTVIAGAAIASASTYSSYGYVCGVEYLASASYGDGGGVRVTFGRDAECGEYLGRATYCSVGATHSYCPTSATYLMPKEGVAMLANLAHRAMLAGQQVILLVDRWDTTTYRWRGMTLSFAP